MQLATNKSETAYVCPDRQMGESEEAVPRSSCSLELVLAVI
ncbi:hypothetical protein [Psychrobacillus sp. MER TA 171]|nr:hypothetical protein [Psychrobacillus sp. MER TA 171]